jgi:hypothetical protein
MPSSSCQTFHHKNIPSNKTFPEHFFTNKNVLLLYRKEDFITQKMAALWRSDHPQLNIPSSWGIFHHHEERLIITRNIVQHYQAENILS